MSSGTVFGFLGIACALAAAASLSQRIVMARSHRDVASMAVGGVALVVVVLAGASMLLAPHAWASAYAGAMSFMGQR